MIFRFGLRSEGAVNFPSSQWVSGKTLLYIQGMKPQETVECLFLICLTLTQIDFNIIKFHRTGLEIKVDYQSITR